MAFGVGKGLVGVVGAPVPVPVLLPVPVPIPAALALTSCHQAPEGLLDWRVD